ncbi:Helix-turn-helix domain [Candidatus Nitrososphaera evergladensis SR1]|jgi:predicted transcriptional regulator|uniref:Helix-turn-helix domain n=1 Tax=Candidatus Nitrososphaera evergladensis SR1 TaxID=1459636 RepID=A0A075MUI4_9ARCH|nr:helix-turn-helix domain-containing protein [Candidatus Nitrososphaera evergladensis]AIF84875.1 Helix-turn-helix domain [Candidatus Nitrososphaera evergladensis SR1]
MHSSIPVDGSDEPVEAASLFMELASETRCAIIASVANRPAKLSTLARELGVTVQDVHRNANRLLESGILERRDGEFYLSEFGRAITMQLPYFRFMKKHSRFFQEHTLAFLPDKFVHRMGALEKCRMVETVTVVMQDLKKLEMSATRQLKVMVSQAWPEEGQILIDRARRGVELRTIIGCNTVFPQNVMDEIIPAMAKLTSANAIEQRMVDKVSTALYIADGRAAIMFPNAKGEVDMGAMLAGDSPEFVEWCTDLFDHAWLHAGPADVRKAKIV